MGLLDSILGGLAGGAGGAMRPRGGGLQARLVQALIAALLRRATQGGGLGGLGGALGGGGLGGVLGGILGGGGAARGVPGGAARGGGGGGMGGLGTLGGLGALAGLAILASRLKQGGLGDAVGSWIGSGPNQPVSGQQLRGAIDADVLDELAGEFGLSPDEVSEQLAGAVPEVVDEITPGGRWPDPAEAAGGEAVPGMEDLGELLRRFDAR